MADDVCCVAALGRKLAGTLTRSEKKRLAIVEAARKVFLEKGFETASMDLISAEAGVSKRTVYSHFGSKEDLFAGIMFDMCAAKRDSLQTPIDTAVPIEDSLTRLGYDFLKMIFEQEGMALIRILVGHVDQLPGLGKEFFDRGPREVRKMLADYLADRAQAGVIAIDNPVEAAGSFLASLFGPRHIQCLITGSPPPTADEVDIMVSGAVKRFLNGVLVQK